MKKVIFLTTIIVVLFFIPKIVLGAVVINEIMYDLEGSDTDREWVEILNNSDAPIDLTGWKFFENNTNHGLTIVQGNIILSPNGHAVIADKPDKFLLDNPGYSGTLFDSAFSLSNSGESLALKNKNLTIVEEINYVSAWGANGNGRSLQKENPNEANWGSGTPTPGALNNISPEEPEQESTPEQPETPSITTGNNLPIADAGNDIIGFINQEIQFDGTKSSDPDNDELAYSWNMGNGELIEEPIFTYKYLYPGAYLVTLMVYDGRNYAWDTINVKIQSQQITINEFLPNPSGKDEEEEWIEIYNDSDSIVDISGWLIDDEEGGSKPFAFPQNTLIAPKNYLVFPRTITKLALNNTSDSVRLLLPEGIVFQEISYEKPSQGQSSARTGEGFIWSAPTPGMANIISIPETAGSEKEISYQYEAEKQMVQEYTKESTIEYSPPKQQIEGGYTYLSDKEKPEEKSQLATIKEIASKQGSTNLILIILAIVLGAFAIGLFLTKFRKKFP